ncbi:MAG: zf-HC2 domain-containing protein [Oscillospiraceae bacterium]|nr:zf-HC2 domain-containing protein [Oscillospiraceae bacterium]
MRNECNIIRDILPLYAEDMVSSDTLDFVEEHLKTCEECKKELKKAKEPQPVQYTSNSATLVNLSRKLKIKKLQTVALTAVFITAIFVSAFAALDAPIYFPYSDNLITPEQLGGEGMLLTFDEKITEINYTVYNAPDGDLYYCDIEAWTSLWDKWFSKEKGKLSAAVTTEENKPIIAVYIPNDGTENICIAKYDPNAEIRIDKNVDFESGIVLPRLSLGYYLISAGAAMAVLGIIWVLTRKKTGLNIWIERIGLYPLAYIIAHCIISGINWNSYSLPRDFSLTVFISILLYGGLILAHNIWHLKKEIKEISPPQK